MMMTAGRHQRAAARAFTTPASSSETSSTGKMNATPYMTMSRSIRLRYWFGLMM